MRFIFKTNYDQDIRLLQHSGHWLWYGLLGVALIALPWLVSNYLQSQLVFVFIYAIVGVALMILTGFTGQGSLGHAAFLAIGAYTAAYFQKIGMPFIGIGIVPWEIGIPIPFYGKIGGTVLLPHLGYLLYAGIFTGVVGIVVGFPALRLHGIYLLMATMSFGFIVEEILARWESVTNGNEGLQVKALQAFGATVPTNSPWFYYVCLAVLFLVILGTLNLMRSATGRAFIAIRDSETAAKSMGIDLAGYKVRSFGLSAAITGFAGALFAHKLTFISPEMFTLLLSIEFIMVIIIGGALGLHGAILGAMFIVMIDPLFITPLKDTFGGVFAAPGFKGAIYGLLIVMFILFEPLGLYGRWLKIKLFFQMFPLYKKATFKRQKTYVKSERNR